MAKFKVGDRVRYNGEGANVARAGAEAVVEREDGEFIFLRWVRNGLDNGQMDGGYFPRQFELIEAAKPALTVQAGKFYKTRDGRKVGPMVHRNEYDDFIVKVGDARVWERDGSYHLIDRGEHDIVAEWVDEPTAEPTPLHVTLGIDLNPVTTPQVGDAVLIKGTLAAINHSPRGTNYNIVFETQNRRVSLHFLEEDFVLDDGDNGPLPYGGDTAKAFDGLSAWLQSLAVARAA